MRVEIVQPQIDCATEKSTAAANVTATLAANATAAAATESAGVVLGTLQAQIRRAVEESSAFACRVALRFLASLGVWDIVKMVTMPWAMLSSCMFLSMELVQLYEEGITGYFESAWNYLDIGAFSLQIVVDIQLIFQMHPDYIRPTASVSVLLLFFKILFYARGFRSWGPLRDRTPRKG